MVERIDTSTLGPIRIDSSKTPQKRAEQQWWRGITREGDPLRRSNLVGEAHAAGWEAALRFAEAACDLPPHYLDRVNQHGGRSL